MLERMAEFAAVTELEDDEDVEDLEEENEELLLALEESLTSPAKRQACSPLPALTVSSAQAALGYRLVHWPVEVRLCIATFLGWLELMDYSLLCRAWRVLELEDALWQEYFIVAWPRLARRREAGTQGVLPWRALFRARWERGNCGEDALEEDWLDFNAAQGLAATVANERRLPTSTSHETSFDTLQRAMRRCREDLRRQGIEVPEVADPEHVCGKRCRFHRLLLDSDEDAFLCEVSGALHQCKEGVPCPNWVSDAEECFMVCPISGRCCPRNNTVNEEAPDAVHDWDPELNPAQQAGRWFEQGYSMSEEQARDFFGQAGDGGGGSRRQKRQLLCKACKA